VAIKGELWKEFAIEIGSRFFARETRWIPKGLPFGAVWCAQHQRRGLGMAQVPKSRLDARNDLGVQPRKILATPHPNPLPERGGEGGAGGGQSSSGSIKVMAGTVNGRMTLP
jgi:hypothetical protein